MFRAKKKFPAATVAGTPTAFLLRARELKFSVKLTFVPTFEILKF
jgi:hypothetical protein